LPPIASVRPSGLKATAYTTSVKRVRVASEVGRLRFVRSHNHTVLSALLAARVCPSGLKEAE